MGFIGDLVNRPQKAIETIEQQRNLWKSAVLVAVTGFLTMINFFFGHFSGDFPGILPFVLILAILGILFLLMFVLGFVLELYVFLKITKYEGAGNACKTAAWCYLIPLLIFQGGYFVLNLFLRFTGTFEFASFIYDNLIYLMYIWVLALAVVAVVRDRKEFKVRNMAGVIGIFVLNWAIWIYINQRAMGLIFTGFII